VRNLLYTLWTHLKVFANTLQSTRSRVFSPRAKRSRLELESAKSNLVQSISVGLLEEMERVYLS
jgi:hypothetical protein